MPRKKIGVLAASANSTIEHEFQTLVGGRELSVHTTRLSHRKLSEESVRAMRKDALEGARLLADAEVDCIVYGITAASFLLGPDHDDDLVEEIRRETGIAALTVVQGVLRALEEHGVKCLSLATPYSREVTEREARFFGDLGYEVAGYAGLGLSNVAEIGRLQPDSVLHVASNAFDPKAEVLFVSCTNWHTLPQLATLESTFSVPTFSSNSAAFDLAVDRIFHKDTPSP